MNLSILSTNKLRTIAPEDIKKGLFEIITWAYRACNIEYDEDLVVFNVRQLSDDCKTDYPQLTLKDISQAIQRGVKGNYGKVYRISVSVIHEWIKAYIAELKPINGTTEHELVRMRLAEPKELGETEKEAIFTDCYNTVYDIYKRTGVIDDKGNACCKGLWNRGKIQVTYKQWDDYIARATEIIKAELNEEKEDAKANINRIRIREIENMLINVSEDLIKPCAMRLVLKDYFDRL